MCDSIGAMTRRLGVMVALFAFAATASADKTATKKPAKADAGKKNPHDDAKAPPPDDAPLEGSAAEPPEELPPHIEGPKLIDLGHNAEIDLPAGMILLERVEAQKFIAQSGDSGENILAVIVKLGSSWWISVDYEDAGYVDDSDADKLDANEMLESYREGVKEQNVRRREMGKPDMFLDGWTEMPKYTKGTHQLVWGLKGHSTKGTSINFFTRNLGRVGYLSIDLIDSPENIEKSKVEATPVLAALRFKPGAKYEEHKSGDKSSGIGLRALVLGGAGIAVLKGVKAGVFVKLLLVFKKVFILIFAAIAGFFKWLFGKKKTNLDVPPSDPPMDPPPNT
jgi:uncharacterized membrane-anchored protein